MGLLGSPKRRAQQLQGLRCLLQLLLREAEVTELLRAVSLQTAHSPPPRLKVSWGCGQPGHLVRECPKSPRAQGNGSGGLYRPQPHLQPHPLPQHCFLKLCDRQKGPSSTDVEARLTSPRSLLWWCGIPLLGTRYVPVTMEGLPCSALVDTGSTVTLVRLDVVLG